MSIQVISNLNYPIGNIINLEFQNSYKVQIAVAFLKYSGIKIIDKSLKQCLNNGGNFEIIAGLDFKTTDPKALSYLISLKKEYSKVNLYCFGDKGENKTSIVFHPKLYLFEGKNETTAIVGSTNLTGGGLISNLEVNTVFKEKKPIYYSQIQAIYNSIKFTESIFAPDEEYVSAYSEVFKAFSRSETVARKDTEIAKTIEQIQLKENILPSSVPSINQEKQIGVELVEIYNEVERRIEKEGLSKNYKMETLRNSVRGELNTHEKNSMHKSNMYLFERIGRGLYSLTETGKKYKGR
jgi:HKD family nuclease